MDGMHAELRFQYGDRRRGTWLLEIVGERDGGPVTYFSDSIGAAAGREIEEAISRLARAGYTVTGWREVEGGWDGVLSAAE